jgi:tetratricopeptide (TPR) repeat protein
MHAIAAWLLLAPFLVVILYFPLKKVFIRLTTEIRTPKRTTFKTLVLITSLFVLLVTVPGMAEKSLVEQADSLYAQRSDLSQDLAALDLYEKALAQAPVQNSLYWKASRACWWAGTRTDEQSAKLHLLEKGIAYGKQAVQKDPSSVEPHFWLGSNYASYAHAKGAFTSLFLIKRIREEMNETSKIDESYLYGGADRVLGILDYEIPGIVGGNRARALAHLQKALTFSPEHPVTRFYMADYYAEGKDYDRAKQELRALAQIQIPPDLKPEWLVIQPEVAALTKKLEVL